MKSRMVIAALAFLMAVALSYAAPEHSTALVYRLSVFAFVLLLFVSRVSSMGIFTSGSHSYGLNHLVLPADHRHYR